MNTGQEVFKAYSTIKCMIKDRQLEEVAGKLDRYSSVEIQQLATRSVFTIDVESELRILFHLGKFKGADIKRLLEDRFSLYILVTREKLSSVNVKQLTEMNKHIDIFDVTELLFNISHHSLVPKHEAIRDATSIKDILERYRVKTRHQLPIILKSDPMARYLGLRPGELVRITRISPGAGEYILYRCCV